MTMTNETACMYGFPRKLYLYSSKPNQNGDVRVEVEATTVSNTLAPYDTENGKLVGEYVLSSVSRVKIETKREVTFEMLPPTPTPLPTQE